jgi:hypothetical protein
MNSTTLEIYYPHGNSKIEKCAPLCIFDPCSPVAKLWRNWVLFAMSFERRLRCVVSRHGVLCHCMVCCVTAWCVVSRHGVLCHCMVFCVTGMLQAFFQRRVANGALDTGGVHASAQAGEPSLAHPVWFHGWLAALPVWADGSIALVQCVLKARVDLSANGRSK